MNNSGIRTERVTHCPVCGTKKRNVSYEGLSDRVFGAPGEWSLKRCQDCGLLFSDPRPTEEDIGKIYATYYTHSVKAPPSSPSRLLREYVRRGYLAFRFGYAQAKVKPLQRLLSRLAYLHPEERQMIESSVMYLPGRDRGRVLDVGSGAGETMKELRRLGWEVEGVDFDADAVEVARRSYGLDVRLGTLESQNYPSNRFDAVVMSHVIEHVHHPVEFLSECRRVLKPGGRLIVITPNTASLGHRLFGVAWLPLDPPRHLVLFSRKTLALAAQAAGLSRATVETTVRGAYGIFIESRRIRRSSPAVGQPPSSMVDKFSGHAYQYLLSLVLLFDSSAGEELLMVATKEDDGAIPPLT
ncbi:methyltransferase domain-containing protein [Rubrobacter marinus]|uniref:Methyltransferase domain-containing protein n=1 Tax=Rubrobacter marinus TaxID=2653852 RepID=A0A6G8PUU7_9ACTN|nr:class I SAM-dependent methyltransferase [Rubrobacter marinus]QIN77695.1 methyltransferase domain-containing protein [Rubrobacter marinus]